MITKGKFPISYAQKRISAFSIRALNNIAIINCLLYTFPSKLYIFYSNV